LRIPQSKQHIVPVIFGECVPLGETRTGALLVSKELLRNCKNLSVAVVGGDNNVALRPVKVGERVDTMWVIESGVQAEKWSSQRPAKG